MAPTVWKTEIDGRPTPEKSSGGTLLLANCFATNPAKGTALEMALD